MSTQSARARAPGLLSPLAHTALITSCTLHICDGNQLSNLTSCPGGRTELPTNQSLPIGWLYLELTNEGKGITNI